MKKLVKIYDEGNDYHLVDVNAIVYIKLVNGNRGLEIYFSNGEKIRLFHMLEGKVMEILEKLGIEIAE